MTFLIAPRFVGPCCPCTYVIENSVYGDGSSGYLSRTPGVAGNRKTFTMSCWYKETYNTAAPYGSRLLLSAGTSGTSRVFLGITTGANKAVHIDHFDGAQQIFATGVPILRDPTAWSHYMFVLDTTEATASDRIKFFINNERQALTSATYPTLNYDTLFNTTIPHTIFCGAFLVTQNMWDSYCAEYFLIDGQALDPSVFGEYDTSGNWVPINPSGLTFGTNGFLLDFSNGADLGEDSSGNGNDWATNGTITQTTDSPTDDAENGIGNFCTLNPLDADDNAVLSSGNTVLDGDGANVNFGVRGTITLPESGKWGWTCTVIDLGAGVTRHFYGVVEGEVSNSTSMPAPNMWGYYQNGDKVIDGTASAYGSAFSASDEIFCYVDMDAGTIGFVNDGVDQGSFSISGRTAGATLFPWLMLNFDAKASIDFNPVPPSGFEDYKPLCTANLPAPTPPGSVSPITGSFTGNASADGPFVWLGYTPDTSTTSTINSNTITWGTHAFPTAGGFKIITSSSSYNNAGSNSYSIAVDRAFGGAGVSQARAQLS